jgi:carbon monoxide dehydrogenase subunit G
VRLDHEFTVPAPPAEVWAAVTDPESVAPCMPGATLTKVEGDTFTGTVKVKLGPISLTYKGSGEFLEKDEAARKIVIKASGKDQRGAGTAAATVTVTLAEDGGGTKGTVATDLSVTGRPAQFGRGMISEVGGKILDQFATNLAEKLSSGAAAAEEKPAAEPATAEAIAPKPKLESVKPAEPAREAEAIDLFDLAGNSVLKRVAPVLAAVAALLGVVAIVRAARKKKH